MKQPIKILIFILLLLFFKTAISQSALIKEEAMSLDTYGFGKPNPVPILKDNPKIYPYFKFEEYEHDSKKKDWQVVTLENEYIKVFVLPEIGVKYGELLKSQQVRNSYIKMRL